MTWDDSEFRGACQSSDPWETLRDLTTGERHESPSHPRSVTYYCITAFYYALSIRKINSTVIIEIIHCIKYGLFQILLVYHLYLYVA